MSEIKNFPALEACGWFVRTKRTAEDPSGFLIADCSDGMEGAKMAQLFAAAPDLLEALIAYTKAYDENPHLGPRGSAVDQAFAKARIAVAKATGAPRFPMTSCSQCGKELGPGDHGVSHCEHHGA